MTVTNARYTSPDNNVIDVVIDGIEVSIRAVVGNSHYDYLIANNIAIADYVAPAIDAAALRAQALATLDPLICQINRYILLGEDATKAKAKLETAMAEIDSQYPLN